MKYTFVRCSDINSGSEAILFVSEEETASQAIFIEGYNSVMIGCYPVPKEWADTASNRPVNNTLNALMALEELIDEHPFTDLFEVIFNAGFEGETHWDTQGGPVEDTLHAIMDLEALTDEDPYTNLFDAIYEYGLECGKKHRS